MSNGLCLQRPIADTDAEPVKIPEFFNDSNSVFKGRYHRRVHSNGNFQSTAADDSGGELSGDLFNGSFSDTDDLVNEFLELDKDNGDCVHPDGCDGDGDGDGDDEWKKSMRRRQRGLRGHEAMKALPPQKLAEIWNRDATGLTTENAELKIWLQAMEQQAQLGEGTIEAPDCHRTYNESQRAS
ncbi:uncharacterized protein LOC130761448 [Actinidia eriantha]|uniref:uncharacterized protein LOC130761448 n=1 Tax=Actinidia eriantha TaxID=165200 RepID=UPI00258FA641|nr:uncharacterized protein LOC130761448 [Actinidia eriantha]